MANNERKVHLYVNLIEKIVPPSQWKVAVILIWAIFSGLALFTFYIANAHSYLSDDPKTCVNCHIMAPQYATWLHSSHREHATCNDCHVPQDNIFNSYYFKAKDGLRHSTIFTLRGEPQVIQILDEGSRVVQNNCIRCHIDLISDPRMNTIHSEFHNQRTEKKCWDCHREVPHGRVKSLTSTPYARVPLPESPVPEWLKKIMTKK